MEQCHHSKGLIGTLALSACLLGIACVQSAEVALAQDVSIQSFVAQGGVAQAHVAKDRPTQLREEQLTSRVLVRVRAVKASEAIEEDRSQEEVSEIPREVDTTISDLVPQLKKLHFKTFRLISSEEKIIPPRKKEIIQLVSGNTLLVRPLYSEHEKICLWLKWKDKSGMEVLDTRMHFAPGESLLTGTDSAPDSGLILAINVNPVENGE